MSATDPAQGDSNNRREIRPRIDPLQISQPPRSYLNLWGSLSIHPRKSAPQAHPARGRA